MRVEDPDDFATAGVEQLVLVALEQWARDVVWYRQHPTPPQSTDGTRWANFKRCRTAAELITARPSGCPLIVAARDLLDVDELRVWLLLEVLVDELVDDAYFAA